MCTKPSRSQHKRLSDSVGLTERQSKIWFQNKRQRQRNAISMSQNDSLKEEITEMAENLQDIKYRSNILEIENQYLNSDLKKKTAQLEELQNLKYLLFDIKKTSCIAATS
jgi:vacuolar-type H+-ATPase subunit I/STV1